MISEETRQKLLDAASKWEGDAAYCALERLPDQNEQYLTEKGLKIGLTISQGAGVMDGWDYGDEAHQHNRWGEPHSYIQGLGAVDHTEWLEGVALGIEARKLAGRS